MNRNIYLSPHFSLKEMTDSQTAKKRGIANVPSEQEIENLRRLCQGTLEPLREALGLPIIITSGYRCKALNNILGHSSKNSQHMAGRAADFYVSPRGVSGSKDEVSSSKIDFVEPFAHSLQIEPSRRGYFGSSSMSCSARVQDSGEQDDGSSSMSCVARIQNLISKLISGFKFLVSSDMNHGTGESPMKLETNSRRELLIKAFRTIILDERIDYDQLILYPTFIHVSYVSRERNRRRLTKGSDDGKYCALSLEQALKIE